MARHGDSRSIAEKCVLLMCLVAVHVAGKGEKTILEELLGGVLGAYRCNSSPGSGKDVVNEQISCSIAALFTEYRYRYEIV